MDDLDKFRAAWEQINTKESKAPVHVSADEIIRKRSGHVAKRFRNLLLLRFWAGAAIIAGFLSVYLLSTAFIFGVYLPVVFVLMLFCTLYYFHQQRKLKRLEPPSDADVKTSLGRMLKWMNSFVLLYLRLNQVIISLCIIIMMIVVVNSSDSMVSEVSGMPELIVFLVILLTSLLITLAFSPIQKIFIRRKFGRYMQQLRANLSELEEIGMF